MLVEPRDRLHYVYDFGDGWEHVVRLEAVIEQAPVARRDAPTVARGSARGPRRRGLPGGGRRRSNRRRRARPGRAQRIADGPLRDCRRGRAWLGGRRAAAAAWPVGGLRVRATPREAQLDRLVLVDPTQASAMVERYIWLLDAVGDKGIRLTAAGYLPPRVVEAAWTALELDEEWIAAATGRSTNRAVADVAASPRSDSVCCARAAATFETRAGQRLRHDPVALWWHSRRRLAPADETFEGTRADPSPWSASPRVVTWTLICWSSCAPRCWWGEEGGQLTGTPESRRARHARRVMHLHAFSTTAPWKRGTPTPGGRALARAALRGSA